MRRTVMKNDVVISQYNVSEVSSALSQSLLVIRVIRVRVRDMSTVMLSTDKDKASISFVNYCRQQKQFLAIPFSVNYSFKTFRIGLS